MSAAYTIRAIQAVVGDAFTVRTVQSGFQANLKVQDQRFNDGEKCEQLLACRDALQAAGYDTVDTEQVKLTIRPRTGNGPWTPWYCVYIPDPALDNRRGSGGQVQVVAAGPDPDKLIALKAAGFSTEEIVQMYGKPGGATGNKPKPVANKPEEQDDGGDQGEGDSSEQTESPI